MSPQLIQAFTTTLSILWALLILLLLANIASQLAAILVEMGRIGFYILTIAKTKDHEIQVPTVTTNDSDGDPEK